MLLIRRHRPARLLAFLLLTWLVADSLCHGVCRHDVVAFAHATSSQLGDGAPSHRSSDGDDVNYCSCHWHFLPAPALLPAETLASAPVICTPPVCAPQAAARSLERPPQGFIVIL